MIIVDGRQAWGTRGGWSSDRKGGMELARGQMGGCELVWRATTGALELTSDVKEGESEHRSVQRSWWGQPTQPSSDWACAEIAERVLKSVCRKRKHGNVAVSVDPSRLSRGQG